MCRSMHVAQCPTTEARRGLARGVVARGLRHEPTATVAQRRAEDRETVSVTRASPGRNETLSDSRLRAERQAHAHRGIGKSIASRTQDGLEFNPPVFLDVRKACAGKRVLIMGLPGAFTPC